MGLIIDVVRPYWLPIKVGILAIALSYVGVLHWQISALKHDNRELTASVSECHEHAKDLTIQNAIHERNIEKLQAYYRNKKCLDLRPGELRDEEFKLQ